MVHYEPLKHCHVSGHGSREELKLMLGLVKPRNFIPVHGEYRMLVQHGLLAEAAGVPVDGIFVLENGQVVEFDGSRARLAGSVPDLLSDVQEVFFSAFSCQFAAAGSPRRCFSPRRRCRAPSTPHSGQVSPQRYNIWFRPDRT